MIAVYPEARTMKENGAAGRAYYTPKDAAKRLRVSPSVIYDWISRGDLPSYRAGPRPRSPLRIPAEAIEKLAAEMGL
jgi:excisionase family DNA binding protein